MAVEIVPMFVARPGAVVWPGMVRGCSLTGVRSGCGWRARNSLAACARPWSLMGMSTNSLPIRPSVEPAGRLEVERYVSRAELAAIMGVSIAPVDRMVAEGMPSVTWGRRTRRFRPSAAISWASERGRAAA